MRLALPLVIVGLALAGCRKAPDLGRVGVLRYPMATKPTSLDPGKVQDGDSISIVSQVYEGLVARNEQNHIVPCLADKWTLSPDRKTYTFHIRPGVRFSNGRLLTAYDFKWCLERNCSHELSSQTARRFLNDIQGVPEVLAGRQSTIAGIVVVNSETLSVALERPRAYFLEKLTLPVGDVYAKEALSNPGKEFTIREEMVGTGAFKFDAVNFDQEVDLVANAQYWNGKPKLDRIERPYVPDPATRLTLYRTGDVNFLRLERQDIPSIESDPVLSKQLHFSPRPALWYFGIDSSLTAGLQDVRVRRAIAMSIDRTRIVKEILKGVNPLAECIVPPGVFGHQDTVKILPYDPPAARKLLAVAGFRDGRGLPEITIWCRNNQSDIQVVAEAIGQDLTKNLGIRVSFQVAEWAQLLAELNARRVPFLTLRWSADYLDAQDFLSGLLSSHAAGDTLNYHNPDLDRICEIADASANPGERQALYSKAEKIAIDDAVMVPICFERDGELVSPRVHGIRNTLVGHMPHTQVTVR